MFAILQYTTRGCNIKYLHTGQQLSEWICPNCRNTILFFLKPNNASLLRYIAYIHDFYIHSSKHDVKLADMVPQKTEDNTMLAPLTDNKWKTFHIEKQRNYEIASEIPVLK